MLSQPFEVKLNGLANQLQCLFSRFADCDATREVRHTSTERVLALFNDDDVVQFATSLLQSGLPQSAVQRTWRNPDTLLARHGDGTAFCGVVKLMVTASVRTRNQPSASSRAMRSFTFIGMPRSLAFEAQRPAVEQPCFSAVRSSRLLGSHVR